MSMYINCNNLSWCNIAALICLAFYDSDLRWNPESVSVVIEI